MTARDKYGWSYRCECGYVGVESVSENDGHAFLRGDVDRSIDHVDEGMKPFGDSYKCISCGSVMVFAGPGVHKDRRP